MSSSKPETGTNASPEKEAENRLIYGKDVNSIKLRAKGRFTVTAYVDGYGVRKITNDTIDGDVKIIDGNRKVIPGATNKLYFTREQFEKFGFEIREATVRRVELPSQPDASAEVTGVRQKIGSQVETVTPEKKTA